MLNTLKPFVVRLKTTWPSLYFFLVKLARRFLGNRLGIYPKLLGNEVEAVSAVLQSSQWNMAYGRGLVHERLEAEFANYVGVSEAIAVGSGGVALQMSMRALGIKPGDEVIHQVDTCSATAMACMNAGATPIFSDISNRTYMLNMPSVERLTNASTRAIIGTHMWGNPECMSALREYSDNKGLKLIEDACLGLGAKVEGRSAGAWGDVGVFSFGCIKPIQGGEGGMIVTDDKELARELRAMRHWGDRTIEYGERDATQLSWNGRMSEIIAAVVREQLKGFPAHLEHLRENVAEFSSFLDGIPQLKLVYGNSSNVSDPSYTQIVLRIDNDEGGLAKGEIWNDLEKNGIQLWHANFELITSLSFFRQDIWKDWILRGDIDRVERNYSGDFPVSKEVFERTGLGLGMMNFGSKENLKHLKSTIQNIFLKRNKV